MLPALKLLMPMLPVRCPRAGGGTGGKLAPTGREPVLAARRHTQAINSLRAWYPSTRRSDHVLQQQSQKFQGTVQLHLPIMSAPVWNSMCKHASKNAENILAQRLSSDHLTETACRAANRRRARESSQRRGQPMMAASLPACRCRRKQLKQAAAHPFAFQLQPPAPPMSWGMPCHGGLNRWSGRSKKPGTEIFSVQDKFLF